MKVLLVNGSPNVNGTTKFALNEVAKSLNEEGIETEIIDLGNKAINDCIACGYCASHEGCVFNDIVNEFVKKASEADGFVFGSPVYYGHPTGRILSFLDRVFYSGKSVFKHKVGASVTKPSVNDADTGYTALTQNTDITVASGDKIVVVEVVDGKIKKSSEVTNVVVGA